MSIFVVLTESFNDKVEEVIKQKFPGEYFRISAGQWLVSTASTSKELTETLGVIDKDKGPGPAVIFSISSFYGMWSEDLWEWLTLKFEKSNG